jgi:uncharacterized membrane protein (DUF2068 family)
VVWDTPLAMAAPGASSHRPPLTPGFVGIIVFKFLKCAAFVLVGAVALRLARLPRHSQPLEIARAFGIDEGRVTVRHVAALLSAFTPRQVQALGLAAVVIGLVFAAEGACLLARLWWSPYLTIALTAAAVPAEIYEIARRPGSARRYVLLAINLAILAYLWKRRNEFRKRAPAAR